MTSWFLILAHILLHFSIYIGFIYSLLWVRGSFAVTNGQILTVLCLVLTRWQTDRFCQHRQTGRFCQQTVSTDKLTIFSSYDVPCTDTLTNWHILSVGCQHRQTDRLCQQTVSTDKLTRFSSYDIRPCTDTLTNWHILSVNCQHRQTDRKLLF